MTVEGVVVEVALLKVVKEALAEVWFTPCKTAEKMAANSDGRRKWKMTLLESITPF